MTPDQGSSAAAGDLSDVEFGARVRALRLRLRLSQKQLADKVGVTASFVSQLETGRTHASVATLRRLADALGVLVSELFDASPLPPARVVRATDTVWETGPSGALVRAVTHAPQVIEATWFVIPQGSAIGPSDLDIESNAETVIVVVGGSGVSVSVADEDFVLHLGDSLACDSRHLQAIANPNADQADLLALSCPPFA